MPLITFTNPFIYCRELELDLIPRKCADTPHTARPSHASLRTPRLTVGERPHTTLLVALAFLDFSISSH
jgi:hypothetical protein